MPPELHELIEKHLFDRLASIPERNLSKTHIHSLTYFLSLAAKNSMPFERVALLLADRLVKERSFITL